MNVKKFSVQFLTPAILCLIAHSVAAADWVHLFRERSSNLWLIDAQSIEKTDSNWLKAWIKIVYSKEGIREVIKSEFKFLEQSSQWGLTEAQKENTRKKYSRLAESMHLYEIDCRSKALRRLSTIEYDTEGSVIDSWTTTSPAWNSIIPESTGEGLYEAVCLNRPRIKGFLP